MNNSDNAAGATDAATEIAGQANDDAVSADVSRADAKTDSGMSENDAGEGTIQSLDEVELPGPAFDIGSTSIGPETAAR